MFIKYVNLNDYCTNREKVLVHLENETLDNKRIIIVISLNSFKMFISRGRLMLCKISSFHDGDHEECRLLGCYAMWLL
jgi:hypothetical protein